MRYVRGPLREELMLQGATYVPFGRRAHQSSTVFHGFLNMVIVDYYGYEVYWTTIYHGLYGS